ncbi:GH1 family beta-glucosidase [Azospirillum sp. sgz301742]
MRRRTFLKAAAAGALGARLGAGPAQAAAEAVRFPDGFLWGCSTSAYQIEGAADVDGRGPSVWDRFSRTPGKVLNGDTGDVACDHYHRWPEDVDLMARAGMRAYRFSVAWPRVLPGGTGAANAAGLDFYDRLVDGLLGRGIEPWPCLYHWDLPQALQDKGGWTNRAIAGWFADYAQVVAGRLGDRVKNWVMLNEPSVVAIFGHGMGTHAPGLTGRANCVAALHHQNLAQGAALQALRAAGRGWKLGTVLSLQPVHPVGGLEANRPAAALWDAVWNRSGLDPLFLGRYPELLARDFEPLVKPGDLEAIRQPVDFLGINYYSRMHQQADPGGLFGTGFGPPPEGVKLTGMGWPVEPDGLVEQLLDLRDRYGNPPVYVTENGADYYDWVGPEGKAEDGERIFFIRDHLLAGHEAVRRGANLKGWFAWTLLDNFEWADGYSRHFGLVQVDRQTMKRTPKASYHWYADAIRRNGVVQV